MSSSSTIFIVFYLLIVVLYDFVLQNCNFGSVLLGNDNIYHYNLVNQYHFTYGKIFSENVGKIG